jgi:hypothetical protein
MGVPKGGYHRPFPRTTAEGGVTAMLGVIDGRKAPDRNRGTRQRFDERAVARRWVVLTDERPSLPAQFWTMYM